MRLFGRLCLRTAKVYRTVVLALILLECLEKTVGYVLTGIFLKEFGEVGLVGDETEFHQNGWHCGFPEHVEGVLADAAVGLDGATLQMLRNRAGKEQALFQIGVLHELEEDVRLRIRGVEALIVGFVVVFQEDNRVLPAHHVHVVCEKVAVFIGRLAQNMHGIAVWRGALVGVDVNGHKEVGSGPVGYGRTFTEFHEHVGAASLHYLYRRQFGSDKRREAVCYIEREGFFVCFGVFAHRTCIFSTVTGIYHYCGELERIILRRRDNCREKQREGYADCVFHKNNLLLYFANIINNCKQGKFHTFCSRRYFCASVR